MPAPAGTHAIQYASTMTRTLLSISALSLALVLVSCHAGTNNPGRAYAPDMYYSQAYEPYAPGQVTGSGLSAIEPAENAVPYGRFIDQEADLAPWPFPNLGDADTFKIMPAMRQYANPVPRTEEALAEGQKNYGIYCGICHGANGQGKGYLVTGTSYGGAPANLMDDRLIYGASDGWYYHVLQYGKNSMGAYAYAMTKEQRWQIVHYIRSMQEDYLAQKEADEAAKAAEALAAAEVAGAADEAEVPATDAP